MKHYPFFPTALKLFWFATAASMVVLPTTTGMLVTLGLTTSIIVFQEWINMVKIDDETVAKFNKFKDGVNTRCNTVQETVDGFETTVRTNTAKIHEHEEAIARLRTAGNFKDIN